MKRIILLMLVVVVALTGCASSGFLGFLATTGYVTAKTKKLEEDQAAQIGKLKTQLDELESLKKKMESTLSTMPREVLKELDDAIQAYLRTQ